ncbi:hypothetical protein CIB95_02525 [Lottiidibacillus patelloidae]|uniref:Uncharacterized protein n=1 Tax=Lottiidibacillus patelloidae TaxID=2670334 RepID=A0A263BY10_9BACI|nr:hypothetical protein [Lottiidibacillus patelloidae]OZM58462.1 hypothetical protein CIB95_02525 [Lottiidibacillus patelloidae]
MIKIGYFILSLIVLSIVLIITYLRAKTGSNEMIFPSPKGNNSIGYEQRLDHERKIKKLESELSQSNISDYLIRTYDSNENKLEGNELIILGSIYHTYYYEIKLTFINVSYISCPTFFSSNNIRLATKSEIVQLKVALEPEEIVLVFEDWSKDFYFVVCEDFKYEMGLKYYDENDNPKG